MHRVSMKWRSVTAAAGKEADVSQHSRGQRGFGERNVGEDGSLGQRCKENI